MTNAYVRTKHNREALRLLGLLEAAWHILGPRRLSWAASRGPLGGVPGRVWGALGVLLGVLGTVSGSLRKAWGDLSWS